MLHPQAFVERHEVITVHGGRDGEQLWMTVEPEVRLRELQRPEQELHHIFRRAFGRLPFRHLDRMTPAVRIRPTEGIGQRLDEVHRPRLAVGPKRRPPVFVEPRFRADRCVVEKLEDILFHVGEFILAEHALEDVEAVLVVLVEDVLRETPILVEDERAAVIHRKRPLGAFLAISLDRLFFRAEVDFELSCRR